MAGNTELLHLAVEIGCRLQESGAEIYRVEEAVRRVFQAYGADSGQVFAIPNCLIVSVIDDEGKAISRLRRIPIHGTDISRMERVYDFCRRICRTTPKLDSALEQLQALDRQHPAFPLWFQLLGYFVGTCFFTLFFGGDNLWDALAGGACGVAIGACLTVMSKLNANLFVKTAIAAFLSALLAMGLVAVGVGRHTSFITIGALMALTPGIMFTNFMRDIMAGDTVAGLIKLVEALMTAGAIAMGTFVALAVVGLGR